MQATRAAALRVPAGFKLRRPSSCGARLVAAPGSSCGARQVAAPGSRCGTPLRGLHLAIAASPSNVSRCARRSATLRPERGGTRRSSDAARCAGVGWLARGCASVLANVCAGVRARARQRCGRAACARARVRACACARVSCAGRALVSACARACERARARASECAPVRSRAGECVRLCWSASGR